MAEFFFYDEKSQLVRVRVEDCLNTTKLGYVYQEVNNILKNSYNPSKILKNVKVDRFYDMVLPCRLDKVVSVVVLRRRKGDDEEEILVIEGIEVEKDVFVKFDVLIDVEDDDASEIGPDRVEFAGSFVNSQSEHRKRTKLRLGIRDILEKLGAEGHDVMLITFVPRSEYMPLTIGVVKIEMNSDRVLLHTNI